MNRHSQSWSAVALAGLVLALGVVPGSAASEAHPAPSGTLPGSGYVAVQVAWTGVGEVRLELVSAERPGGMSHGTAFVRPDGSTSAVIGYGAGRLGSDDCTVVRTAVTDPLSEGCEPSAAQEMVFGPEDEGSSSIAIIVSEGDGDAPGVWTLVVYHAYRAAWPGPGAWSLTFTPGQAEVLGVTTGEDALLATPADFEGQNAVGLSRAGAFVSANVGSTLGFHVDGALLGSLRPDLMGGTTPGMTLDGPAGTLTCGCAFFSPLPTPEAPPGDYVVRLDRAAAGHQAFTEATVIVVDVELPW